MEHKKHEDSRPFLHNIDTKLKSKRLSINNKELMGYFHPYLVDDWSCCPSELAVCGLVSSTHPYLSRRASTIGTLSKHGFSSTIGICIKHACMLLHNVIRLSPWPCMMYIYSHDPRACFLTLVVESRTQRGKPSPWFRQSYKIDLSSRFQKHYEIGDWLTR